MEYLSWLFFCLSPFALFCSEDGTGLILCPVFILLGFVFRWIGSCSSGAPTAVVKVKPQEFWEWHYKDRMRNTLAQKETIGDELMAYKDKEARDWATTICGYHNAWVPPEATQEEIARKNGVVTEKMRHDKKESWNRIQYEKYRQLGEFEKVISWETVGEKCAFPWRYIQRFSCPLESYVSWSRKALKGSLSYYSPLKEAPWDKPLSAEEKAIADQWVREYKERFMKEVNDYIENNTPMPTIKYHFQNGGNSLPTEYNKKYGFSREV